MTRTSVAAKPSGGSKQILSDLLIVGTVFVGVYDSLKL
jgi:hypothetical protein